MFHIVPGERKWTITLLILCLQLAHTYAKEEDALNEAQLILAFIKGRKEQIRRDGYLPE